MTNGPRESRDGREEARAGAEQNLVKKFSHDLAEERVNDPDGERFNTKSDTGLQDTPALRAGQASADDEASRHTTKAGAAAARAGTDSRVDQVAMRESHVPSAAAEARSRTAPAFGTRTVDGVRSTAKKTAAKVSTPGREPGQAHDRGRS